MQTLLSDSDGFPTWMYWLSPSTVNLVRKASHDTMYEVNRLANEVTRDLGLLGTISTWERSIGLVTRRLPLGVVMAGATTRRTTGLLLKLERLGVGTLGGLTITSTDSMRFLERVQQETLEEVSSVLKGAHRRQAL